MSLVLFNLSIVTVIQSFIVRQIVQLKTPEGLLVVILTKIKYVILLFYLQWHQSNGMQLGQEGGCH